MNIFTSDISPVISAINLDDERVNKMCLESAQIICTIANKHHIDAPYKPTHAKHPAVLWAGGSDGNFNWLKLHFFALCNEFEHRFDKPHKCLSDIDYKMIEDIELYLHHSHRVGFPSSIGGSVKSCRQVLINKWNSDKTTPKWSYRNQPEWYV